VKSEQRFRETHGSRNIMATDSEVNTKKLTHTMYKQNHKRHETNISKCQCSGLLLSHQTTNPVKYYVLNVTTAQYVR